MDAVKKLISWLQDAHAVEEHAEKVLQSYAALLKDFPTWKTKIEEHQAETRRHRVRVETALRSLGESHSTISSAVAKILGASQSAASTLLGDAVLTSAAAAFALEQLEVATYTSIAAAAEKAGRSDLARECHEIAAEDGAMAAWLLKHLPQLTLRYLERSD